MRVTDEQEPHKEIEKYQMKRFVQTLSISGLALFLAVASASAATVTFNTNGSGTGFNGTSSLVLNSTLGQAATLTFIPEANSTISVPTNVNYGIFSLLCNSCTTLAGGLGAIFPNFTFNLLITDVSDVATGRFVGTSSGNIVFKDLSQINVNWLPAQLGTGTSNALTGSFGPTSFVINQTTRIVSPNSGQNDGQTTIQGGIASSAVPEPVTLGLVGCALIGLGIARRKRS